MAQATHTKPAGRTVPVGELVTDVARDLSTLLRKEIELVKVETRQEIATAAKAGGAFGGAGIAGWLTVIFLSLAAMFGLGAFLALGWAALIVAAVWGVLAAVLALVGRRTLKSFRPIPVHTIETVKEDVRWLRKRNG
jgi:fatty acid desaturase